MVGMCIKLRNTMVMFSSTASCKVVVEFILV